MYGHLGVLTTIISHYIAYMRCAFYLAVVFLVSPPLALGESMKNYGEFILEVESGWPSEAPVALLPSAALPAAGAELLQQLRDRVLEQEFSGGPYAAQLGETLGDLARALDAAGEPEEALRVRRRALHLTRLNDGLYSSSQGPLVRAILDGHRRRGDFTALDEQYRYFFRLFGDGRPPYTGPRWRSSMEFLRWQREALRRDLDRDGSRRLLDLHTLNASILKELMSGEKTPIWRQIKEASLSQLLNLYLVEQRVRPAVEPLRRPGESLRRDEFGSFDLQRDRLETLQRVLRQSGAKLLQDALAVAPPGKFRDVAELRLALADWRQWHGGWQEASRDYLELWQELHKRGLSSLAARWFSKPVPLPDNGAFWLPDRPARELLASEIRVSERGRARSELALEKDSQGRSTNSLRRHLNATVFRPAIRDGRFVEMVLRDQRYYLYE
ncbi:MAG: hypothetical protein ACI87W_002619 [Halieaceae bacterium]|jgi:hypothetical protein